MTDYRLKILISLAVIVFIGFELCTGPKVVVRIEKHGKQLYEQGKFEEAIAELKTQIRKHPKNAQLHYYLGLAHLQQDNLDSAMASYNKAKKVNANTTMDSMYSVIIAQHASKLRDAKKFKAVQAWADQAIALDKKNKQAYYEKYMAEGLKLYYQGSKWELWDAIVAFGNASTAQPDKPMPYYYSAKSYQKKDDKDFTNTIEQYNKALEHNPPEKIASEIKEEIKDLKRRKKLYEDFWGN